MVLAGVAGLRVGEGFHLRLLLVGRGGIDDRDDALGHLDGGADEEGLRIGRPGDLAAVGGLFGSGARSTVSAPPSRRIRTMRSFSTRVVQAWSGEVSGEGTFFGSGFRPSPSMIQLT